MLAVVMLVLITLALLLNSRNQHTFRVHFPMGLRSAIPGQKEGSIPCIEHLSSFWPVADPDNTSSAGQGPFQGGDEVPRYILLNSSLNNSLNFISFSHMNSAQAKSRSLHHEEQLPRQLRIFSCACCQ